MSITCNSNVLKIDGKQWSALLNESKTASVFQTKECYDFYDSLSFLEPFVFSVSENDVLKGVIVGYVQIERKSIKQFFTKRAIINGGPLLSDDISEEALKRLLCSCSNTLKHKAIYVETRNFNDYSKWKIVFEKCAYRYEPHYNFQVDTSSLEVVDANMGKSRKRDAKVSLRDGAVVLDCPCLEDVKAYYLILQDLYKTRVKTPLFPFEFFEGLFKSKFGRFLLVKYQDKIIGGTVCACLDGKTVYEWFACGEDGIYKNIFPSTLATYAGIRYAAENGIKCFDMMGAGKPGDGGYGVRDFKAKFGGELVEQGRFLHVNNRLLYFIGKLGVKYMKKIK